MFSTTEYVGKDTSRDRLIELEMAIHENHRFDEPEAQAKCWFDYRKMLAAERTYLFAEIYRREYVEGYRRTVDAETCEEIMPFVPCDIFVSKDLTAMWLARQGADMLGCKYDFFIRFSFERFANRGWRNLPRPNQLYGEELVLDIRDAWASRCLDVLQFSTSPFYKEDLYVGHPYQIEHHEWVVAQVKKREQRHIALSRVMRERLLPQEVAVQELGADTVKRALLLI